jgi:flavin-dependent dehydrogenase
MPAGFVVLGDAACAFNPVYGQGITTAALEAVALDEFLTKRGPEGPAMEMQKQVARITSTPWALATGEDTRYAGFEGQRSVQERMLQRYVHGVMAASTHDPIARRALLEVFTMLEPPERLMHPSVLLRVLKSALHRPRPCAVDTPAWHGDTGQIHAASAGAR